MGTERDSRFVRVDADTPASDEMLSLTGHDVMKIMCFIADLKAVRLPGTSGVDIVNKMSRDGVERLRAALEDAGGDELDPGDKLMLLCGMCTSAMMSIHGNLQALSLEIELDGGDADPIRRLITPPRER